jgi:hypothetical protein
MMFNPPDHNIANLLFTIVSASGMHVCYTLPAKYSSDSQDTLIADSLIGRVATLSRQINSMSIMKVRTVLVET